MRKWFSRLYNLVPYPDLIERRRAMTVYLILTFGIAIISLFAIGNTLAATGAGADMATATPGGALAAFLVVTSVLALIWVFIRRGWLLLGSWMLVIAGLMVACVLPIADHQWRLPAQYLLYPVVVIISAILIGERGVVTTITFSILSVFLVSLFRLGTHPDDQGLILRDLMSLTLPLIVLGVLSFMLARNWRISLAHFGERAVAQRMRVNQMNTLIAQRIFQRLELDKLLTEIVEMVRDRFDKVYHAQIFLLTDSREYAVLRASTGDAGKELLRNKHQIPVGSQSVIGQATFLGEIILVRDTQTDPIHRQNDLLRNTRAELALPLISGDQIIGALDLQSLEPNPFSQDDIDLLHALTDQIALAIDNARLVLEQQQTIAENRRLNQRLQTQLNEIEELNRRLVGQAWESYLRERGLVPALTVDFDSGAMTPNAAWTPGMSQAVETEGLVVEEGDEKRVMSVPIAVRGQVIGAMEFEFEQEDRTDLDTALLTKSVAERLGLAVENARLYENAQRLARRETIINEISAGLQGASGVESALVAAIQGLQTALDSPHVAIRLGTPPVGVAEPGNGNGQEETA